MMAFVNYGLDWEWRPLQGMWGKTGARGSTPVDLSKQIGIYVLKKGGRYVYVGRSGTGPQAGICGRLIDHARTKQWDQFSWFGVRPVRSTGTLVSRPTVKLDTGQLINDIEAVVIHLLQLKQNQTSGHYKHMVKFIQVEAPFAE